jgi:lactoylglutathione lyase
LPEVTTPSRLPRWTHIALRVRDIEASIAFYVEHAHLQLLTRRVDDNGHGAWLGHPDQREAPFVLVLAQFFAERPDGPDAPIGPFAHLGIELDSPTAVDAIAAVARSDGFLQSGPIRLPDPIGYICMVTDPDGNTIEFSFGQRVFEFAAEHMRSITES